MKEEEKSNTLRFPPQRPKNKEKLAGKWTLDSILCVCERVPEWKRLVFTGWSVALPVSESWSVGWLVNWFLCSLLRNCAQISFTTQLTESTIHISWSGISSHSRPSSKYYLKQIALLFFDQLIFLQQSERLLQNFRFCSFWLATCFSTLLKLSVIKNISVINRARSDSLFLSLRLCWNTG